MRIVGALKRRSQR